MNDYDLVIVGGGIGGSGLATVMQRAGHSCLVLERTTEFPDRTKGEWIAPWGVIDAQKAGLHDVLAEARGHYLTRHIPYDETRDPAEAEAGALELGLVPGIAGPMTQRHPDACQVLFDAATASGAETRRGVEDVLVERNGSPSVRFRHDGADYEARGRLVVGADGRQSVVRKQVGIDLQRDPAHHLFSGLLVDDADGWPAELETAGTEGDLHFLVFPQGGGRVRLYLGFDLSRKHLLAGADGPKEFLRHFRFACVPGSDALADATPVSPCATYANEDTWTDTPAVDGVALVGDAAGWNDPITGQGLSITMRDVRVLSEILRAGDDWSADALRPYPEERSERMRRLRFAASLQSELYAEFGPEARDRRARAFARIAEDPSLMMALLTVFFGPEMAPPEAFTPEARDRLLA